MKTTIINLLNDNKPNIAVIKIAKEMKQAANVTKYTDIDVVQEAIKRWAQQLIDLS